MRPENRDCIGSTDCQFSAREMDAEENTRSQTTEVKKDGGEKSFMIFVSVRHD
jgi:hypothetical protein